jgi:hypothetical protein
LLLGVLSSLRRSGSLPLKLSIDQQVSSYETGKTFKFHGPRDVEALGLIAAG